MEINSLCLFVPLQRVRHHEQPIVRHASSIAQPQPRNQPNNNQKKSITYTREKKNTAIHHIRETLRGWRKCRWKADRSQFAVAMQSLAAWQPPIVATSLTRYFDHVLYTINVAFTYRSEIRISTHRRRCTRILCRSGTINSNKRQNNTKQN